MSPTPNVTAEINQGVGRALARHACPELVEAVGLKPDLRLNAQARELEQTIARNVAKMLEACR